MKCLGSVVGPHIQLCRDILKDEGSAPSMQTLELLASRSWTAATPDARPHRFASSPFNGSPLHRSYDPRGKKFILNRIDNLSFWLFVTALPYPWPGCPPA
jgi:hypothetical protein